MKTYFRSFSIVLILAACSATIFSTACKKDSDDDNSSQGTFWNEDWLIGTWEATTPVTGDPMFDNKKIRLVFNAVSLKSTDTVPHNTVKLWAYSGTLTWDLDAVAPYSMRFFHSEYPSGINSIGWQSASMLEAGATINNISLRVGDSVNMQPNPEYDFDLDWGPFTDYNNSPPTTLDFYGDIEIYVNGDNHRADYLPDAGTMIRFTKK
jgi:hypothetical protein